MKHPTAVLLSQSVKSVPLLSVYSHILYRLYEIDTSYTALSAEALLHSSRFCKTPNRMIDYEEAEYLARQQIFMLESTLLTDFRCIFSRKRIERGLSGLYEIPKDILMHQKLDDVVDIDEVDAYAGIPNACDDLVLSAILLLQDDLVEFGILSETAPMLTIEELDRIVIDTLNCENTIGVAYPPKMVDEIKKTLLDRTVEYITTEDTFLFTSQAGQQARLNARYNGQGERELYWTLSREMVIAVSRTLNPVLRDVLRAHFLWPKGA